MRSIMAEEIYDFSAAFDEAFAIRHDLQLVLNTKIALKMYTDSKQLFDVITRALHTTEKRLMVEIMAAREAYNRHEISNVGLILGDENQADGLTKSRVSVKLNRVLSQGKDLTAAVQWIYR